MIIRDVISIVTVRDAVDSNPDIRMEYLSTDGVFQAADGRDCTLLCRGQCGLIIHKHPQFIGSPSQPMTEDQGDVFH